MVDRVEGARDAQEDAKEQFASALDRFNKVLSIPNSSLQEKYDALQEEYDLSEKKAKAVKNRIAKVEDVSEALFEEWQDELEQYSSAKLRADSEEKLGKTKKQYKKLVAAMKKAEKKIKPVLTAFKDQVLYLKHNLNAQAIASLQNELIAVEDDIAALIKEMENNIFPRSKPGISAFVCWFIQYIFHPPL